MTPIDWWEISAILVLVVVAGLLSACEVSITRTNRVRAYRLREEHRRGARALARIVDAPAPFLNVVLLLTLLVQLGGTTLATAVAVRHFHGAGEVISTVVMTIILFVFAEVTPKTFAVQHTDRVALRLAPAIVAVPRAVGPAASVLIKIANVVMPGRGLPEGPFVTEEEIRAMADVGAVEESIEEEEKDLIHSIFEFGDTLVREVMVPRPDMVASPVDASLRDVLDLILQRGFSRIPVYRGTVDEIVGVAYAKDLLRHLYAGKENVALDRIVRQPHFVPETKKVADLLKEMQQRRVHIAIVLDEYGSVAGLVTIEDLLEEIVGEIADEYDREEPQIRPAGDGRFRVNGRCSIDDLNEVLDADLPHEEWDTVAGLIYSLLGHVPTAGEHVHFDGFEFTVEAVQGRRIAHVLIERGPDEGEPTAGQDAGAAERRAE